MKNQKVSLLRSVRTSKGWVRCKVKTGGTRGWEQRLDNTTEAYGPDVEALGEYQIRWYENHHGESKVRYVAAGETYSKAMTKLDTQQKRLNLLRAGGEAGIEVAIPEASQPLKERMEKFLEKRWATNKITSERYCDYYRTTLEDFTKITNVRYIEQVNADALVTYLNALKARGLEVSSQNIMMLQLGALLRDCDIRLSPLIKEYTPKLNHKKPVSYTNQELKELLDLLYASPKTFKLALTVEVYWKTGLRRNELAFLLWEMVDMKEGLITIKNGQEFKFNVRGKVKTIVFRTKTRTDRELRIPIEPDLLAKLRQWRKDHPQDRFVCATSKGNPDETILLRFKVAAHRAGKSCGGCWNCLHPCGDCKYCRCGKCKGCSKRNGRRCANPHHGEHPCTRIQCGKWTLHRMRHTFATTAARSPKVDMHMLMDLLGHAQMGTTQIYISAAKEIEAQAAFSGMFTR
jgi:integrase